MFNIKSLLNVLLIVAVIFVITGYSYYKMKDFIRGPVITISYPLNGATISSLPVEIVGKATNISYISINNRQVFTNEEGVFKEKLLLSPGYNIINIEAIDKFDRNTQEVLEIVYRKPNENKDAVKVKPLKNQATSTAESTNRLLN